jgi:hypothetical protein
VNKEAEHRERLQELQRRIAAAQERIFSGGCRSVGTHMLLPLPVTAVDTHMCVHLPGQSREVDKSQVLLASMNCSSAVAAAAALPACLQRRASRRTLASGTRSWRLI